MNTSIIANSVSGSNFGSSINLLANNAQARETEHKFSALVDGMKTATNSLDGSVSSKSVSSDPRLPGDFISSFKIESPTKADHASAPSGAAANSGQKGKIDKTSKLYEQSLELESYFVKMMLSSMRATVTKTNLSGQNDFASKMYEDMQYDELSRTMTKNSGFGLADQVYLQLSGKS